MTDDFYPDDDEQYNQVLQGFFGEFGSGANAKIFFLQSALSPADLDKVTLISDIPGAEAWSVRDLFQRDVDNNRVTNGLIPYFKDEGKVKFFNPITLTILPLENETNEVLSDIPNVSNKMENIDGKDWVVYEVEKLYRFRYLKDKPQFARVEWNDTKVKIVAIDGQHRLSALKRFKNDTQNSSVKTDFLQWTIPIVLFSLRKIEEDVASGSLLDVVRNIFIYINTQAKTPNEARQILLTDESVNAVCTQELLEYSHENDVKEYEFLNQEKMPLLFYDWRGTEEEGRRTMSVASIKSIEEIRDWFEEYILGEDFSSQQKSALGIQPIDSLHKAYSDKHLDVTSLKELRKVFRENVLPGIVFLLENYSPYKVYINKLRQIENDFIHKSDVARHAFYQLRFGTHRAGAEIESQVRQIHGDIIDDILDAKSDIPTLLDRDVGMRGVICAYGELRNFYSQMKKGSSTWLEYAEWFTENLNLSYKNGWLIKNTGDNNNLLRHITHDHGDAIINYRLDHAKEALGAFLVVLIAAYGVSSNESYYEIWEQLYDEKSERLYGTLLKGYKKEVRVLLKEGYPNAGKELNEAVKAEAIKRTDKHMDKIWKYLDNII